MTDTFLTVPFSQKDEAKALGARWHADRKQWFIPSGTDPTPFKKWTEISMDESRWTRVPVGTPRLYVDLVPQSAWFQNLRSELSQGEWDVLRKTAYRLSGNRCEVCGGKGEEHPVEAHERWQYDSTASTQKLIGISSLCPACHQASHMGLANVTGRGAEAMAHLKSINGWDDDTANAHAKSAFEEWEVRSTKVWALDLGWLKTCGITLSLETAERLKHFESHMREPGQKPPGKSAPAPTKPKTNSSCEITEITAESLADLFGEL